MNLIDEKLLYYSESFTTGETVLLADLNRETNANVLYPRMLSGHLQGRILAMISHMIKPQYILEIGTYTGYSAICLCEGLAPHGKLITIGSNQALKDSIMMINKQTGLIGFRL